MKCPRSIRELLSEPSFIAQAQIKGLFGDSAARVIRLRRQKKRPCAVNGHQHRLRGFNRTPRADRLVGLATIFGLHQNSPFAEGSCLGQYE